MAFQAYYIPNGPANLASIFPDIPFERGSRYYIVIKDADGNAIGATPINYMDGDCCEDRLRLYFQNYLGGIDGINFCLAGEEHTTKSDEFFRPLKTKDRRHRDGGGFRFNGTANDVFIGSNSEYREEDKDWLDEFFDAPVAWKDLGVVDNQDPDYVPVIVNDGTTEKVKTEDRFIYETTAKVRMANDRIIIRN